MNESAPGFGSDLQASPRPVAVALIGLGILVWFFSIVPIQQTERARVMLFATLMWAVAAAIWKLDNWKPKTGRWFTVLAVMALSTPAWVWLGVAGTLPLMAIPVALSAILIDLSAATSVAILSTALVVLMSQVLPGIGPAEMAGAGLAIWAALAMMRAVYAPVRELARWSWTHYQTAQASLEEARSRRAELEQVLDDLERANQQLVRLNLLAQGLRQSADDARTTKEQFVANVSHELRTPLNMITGFSETILESPETYGKIPPTLLADLAVIHRNAKHLSELIDDVLDLSQVEANRLVLTKEQVCLSEIVEAAAIAVRPLYQSKGLYLKTEVPKDLYLFCDPTRMREVMLNLLSNAGRFTEQGGVCVRAWTENGRLWVSVADTGRGIAAEDMGKLFQPFQQVDGSIRRRYGGTGLGLSLSKQFIELHGGTIGVESQLGVGATFTFQIPSSTPPSIHAGFMQGLNPDWEHQQRTRSIQIPRTTVRPRLVILESGEALRRLITRYTDGLEVASVTSLETALGEVNRVPAQALLVNDVSVSKALERIVSSETLPSDTPTIICSIPGKQEAASGLGVAERLVKPISREALLGTLERIGIETGTVLIVDDDPDALHLFGRMLASSGRGYRVLLARDGREALNILGEHRPDVILLDLIMPIMNGFQFLDQKSQDATLRDIPVIVTSARDPMGQPIVSSAMAITKGGGLSTHQLLAAVEAISKVFATSQAGDLGLTKEPVE